MKEILLRELEELGISRSGRKIRSDKGKTHGYVRVATGPRPDKGVTRPGYRTDTPGYHKKLFDQYIRAHTDLALGEGDDLVRDPNLLFPPQVTNFYKKVTSKDSRDYRSSQRRKNHPEELRWNWFMAEYMNAVGTQKTVWRNRVCAWYFILPEDLDIWTYKEWSWSYVNAIAGHPNRIGDPTIILYNDYARGKWGLPNYDHNGNIVWTK